MRRGAAVLCAGLLAVLVGGCGNDNETGGETGSETGGGGARIEADALPPPPADGFGGPVEVQVGDAPPLAIEVAETPEQRAYGLRGHDEIPLGTGMLFVYTEPQPVRFVMSGVPVPLTAVFVRDHRVVAVEQMAPCTTGDPDDCPRYGPDEEVDAVLEVASPSLPDVAEGQAVTVAGPLELGAPAGSALQ